MAELQSADHHARYDLVTDPQTQRSIEQVVTEPDGGSHGHDIAAEQAEVHSRLPLGDSVAHCRHTGGDLGGSA